MAIEIRSANNHDFEQVGAIFFEELQFHADLLPDRFRVAEPMMTLAWFEEILQNPEKALLVAEENGRLLGQILLIVSKTPDDPIIKPRKFVYVNELTVVASHRGQGIGQKLVAAAQKWVQARGIAEIELNVWETNDQALAFYEKLGFQTVRRRMWIRVN